VTDGDKLGLKTIADAVRVIAQIIPGERDVDLAPPARCRGVPAHLKRDSRPFLASTGGRTISQSAGVAHE